MIVKLLTEHHLEFLSSKGGCRGSSESTLVRMSNCWKSRALAHISFIISVWFVQGTPVRAHIMDDRALHGLSPLAGRQEQAQVSTVQAFVFFLIHDIYIVYSRPLH